LVLYSLLAMCEHHDVNPEVYLADVRAHPTELGRLAVWYIYAVPNAPDSCPGMVGAEGFGFCDRKGRTILSEHGLNFG